VHDQKTGLTWSRCSVGQTWDREGGCVGTPRKFTFSEANTEWAEGWRMPTKDALKTITAGNCRKPAIDQELFPATAVDWYWTSSKQDKGCWFVNFTDGRWFLNPFNCNYDGHVRLIRIQGLQPAQK